MGWQPDPLLLELFDSVQRELADALEGLQRRRECPSDQPTARLSAQTQKVAKLSGALEALEGALERRNNRMVH